MANGTDDSEAPPTHSSNPPITPGAPTFSYIAYNGRVYADYYDLVACIEHAGFTALAKTLRTTMQKSPPP